MDRNVHAFVQYVSWLDLELQLQPQCWMHSAEGGDERRELRCGKGRHRSNAQRVLRCPAPKNR